MVLPADHGVLFPGKLGHGKETAERQHGGIFEIRGLTGRIFCERLLGINQKPF